MRKDSTRRFVAEEPTVKHYPMEEWLDFVRGLCDAPKRMSMERHLLGCPECASTVEMLQKVQRAATADSAYQIPESVLHSARAIFALRPSLSESKKP